MFYSPFGRKCVEEWPTDSLSSAPTLSGGPVHLLSVRTPLGPHLKITPTRTDSGCNSCNTYHTRPGRHPKGETGLECHTTSDRSRIDESQVSTFPRPNSVGRYHPGSYVCTLRDPPGTPRRDRVGHGRLWVGHGRTRGPGDPHRLPEPDRNLRTSKLPRPGPTVSVTPTVRTTTTER